MSRLCGESKTYYANVLEEQMLECPPHSVAAVQCGPVQKLGSDPNLGEPDPGLVQSSGWGLNRTQSPVPVQRWAKNGEPGPNPVQGGPGPGIPDPGIDS